MLLQSVIILLKFCQLGGAALQQTRPLLRHQVAIVHLSQVTSPNILNTTTPNFGKGQVPTAYQPSEDWPFTTTARDKVLSIKAPPLRNVRDRSINFTAYFDDFEAKLYGRPARAMSPTHVDGEVATSVSPVETVRVNFGLKKGAYLTNIVHFVLLAKNRLLVHDQVFDVNITLRLRQRDSNATSHMGARVTQTISQGAYANNNHPIVLRWPHEYADVVKFGSPFNLVNPSSVKTRLIIDVLIEFSHPLFGYRNRNA